MEIVPNPDPSILTMNLTSSEQDLILELLNGAEKEMQKASKSSERLIWQDLVNGFQDARGNRDLISKMERAKKEYEETRQKLIEAGMLVEDEGPHLHEPNFNAPVPSSVLDDPNLDEDTRREIEMISYRAGHLTPGAKTKQKSTLPGAIPPKKLPVRPPGYTPRHEDY